MAVGRRISGGNLYPGFLSTFQLWKISRKAIQTSNFTQNVASSDEVEEWKTAKPFEHVPSHSSYPIFGTFWVYLPLIGAINLFKLSVLVNFFGELNFYNSGKYPGTNIRERPIEMYRICSKKFGPIWKETAPSIPPMVICTQPEDAEKCDLYQTNNNAQKLDNI